MLSLLGNIIWIVFGGIFIALQYIIASLLLMITIIGIPFGLQTLKLSRLALLPFGSEVYETSPPGGSVLSILMNVIWILVGGIWIALSHVLFGLIFCITIVGIPFGLQHFKLAGLSLVPFGKCVRF